MRRAHFVLCALVGLAGSGLVVEGCSSDSSSTPSGTSSSGGSRVDSGGGGTDSGGGDIDSGGGDIDSGGGGHDSGATTLTARATLMPVGDASATGLVTFTEANGAVTLTANISGSVAGKHGMHVHLGTDCTAPGPHYGPDGGPYHGEYSIIIDDAGAGTLTVPASDVTVSAGQWSVVGHAMVFHQLPLPDAGGAPAPRAACGVLQQQ